MHSAQRRYLYASMMYFGRMENVKLETQRQRQQYQKYSVKTKN